MVLIRDCAAFPALLPLTPTVTLKLIMATVTPVCVTFVASLSWACHLFTFLNRSYFFLHFLIFCTTLHCMHTHMHTHIHFSPFFRCWSLPAMLATLPRSVFHGVSFPSALQTKVNERHNPEIVFQPEMVGRKIPRLVLAGGWESRRK